MAVAELRARREAERAWEAEADAQAAREREEREQAERWWAAGHLADEVIEVEDSEDDEEGNEAEQAEGGAQRVVEEVG